jgi:hypothetical protein
MVDDLPGLADDGDRAELHGLLLDSIPGLSDGQRDAMFEHTFEAPADDEHSTDDLIPSDEVFDGSDGFDTDDWDAHVAPIDEPEHVVAEHVVAEDTETGDGLDETHETPEEHQHELADTDDLALDQGAEPDHHADSLPDGHGNHDDAW